MCSHSARASDGAAGAVVSEAAADGTSSRVNAARTSSMSAGFGR